MGGASNSGAQTFAWRCFGPAPVPHPSSRPSLADSFGDHGHDGERGATVPTQHLLGGGDLAVVHERVAMRVPAGLDWPEAGGFAEVFTTAHDALFSQAVTPRPADSAPAAADERVETLSPFVVNSDKAVATSALARLKFVENSLKAISSTNEKIRDGIKEVGGMLEEYRQALTKLGKTPKTEAAFWVEDADQIGNYHGVLEKIAKAGVNIEGYCAVPSGKDGKGTFRVVTSDPATTRKALETAGLKVASLQLAPDKFD